MQLQSPFQEAYLKVHRANTHIQYLRMAIEPFLTRELYNIQWIDGTRYPSDIKINAFIPDGDFTTRQLVYQPTCSISLNLALLLGDAVHNLRAALDIAATTIVHKAGIPTKFITFPFHEKRENLVPEQSSGLRAIQQALPDLDCIKFFVDWIKPYKDGNFPLWALTKLDKIDKHNMIIPTVAVTNILTPEISGLPTNVFIGYNQHVGNANQPIAIYSGHALKTAEAQNDFKVSVRVSFPEGDLFGNEPVIPTLINLSQSTLKTLDALSEFVVTSQAWMKFQR